MKNRLLPIHALDCISPTNPPGQFQRGIDGHFACLVVFSTRLSLKPTTTYLAVSSKGA